MPVTSALNQMPRRGVISQKISTILVLLCGILTIFAKPAAGGERVALIIGNGKYEHTSPLINPPNDAELVASTLKDAGFAVTKLIDTDQRAMKRAMLEFGRRLRGDGVDAGLFYYAGHGVQVEGENFLIPVNARIQSEDEIELEGINVNDFLRVMNSSNSKINIVVLDACRNNPFARSFRSAARGLATVDAPKGTLIAYATAPGDVALDGEGRNSPYTTALTNSILNNGGRPIEAVFKEARKEVLAATNERQLPWETSSVTGDFFFHPNKKNQPQTNLQPAPQPSAEETLIQSFEVTRAIGTQLAWRKFLDRFGDDDANFYVGLARKELASLQPAPEPKVRHVPTPVNGNWTCTRLSPKIAGGRLCVSSILDPQVGNKYGGVNLLDGKSSTAWVEGVKGDGLGESVVVEFSSPQSVSSITLRNGYNKNSGIYRKNGRVKQVFVETSSGYKNTHNLSDNGDWQTIKLPANGSIGWIQLSIDSVYRGTKYRDTAITELRVK